MRPVIKKENLETCLVGALTAGLVLFIVLKFELPGLFAERKKTAEMEKSRAAWLKTAAENLKESFFFAEGKDYSFVRGRLAGECVRSDPGSHCPVSLFKAEVNGETPLFVSGFQFAQFNPSTPDAYPYPPNKGIDVLGFFKKNPGGSAGLTFEIIDYVPNTALCKLPHSKKHKLCTVRWVKKVLLDRPVPAAGLPVKIGDFDWSFSNQALNVSLKGGIESPNPPDVILALYRVFKSGKILLKEAAPKLQGEGGIYAFEFNKSFSLSSPEGSYSLLFLAAKKDSFHAREWTFDDGRLINTLIYD